MAENEVPIHLAMAIDLAQLLESEAIFDFDLFGVAMWLRGEVAAEQIAHMMRIFAGEHAHD